jgi:hypothetical protein
MGRLRLLLAAALLPKDWHIVRVERPALGSGPLTDYIVEVYG